jgi:hypothetical protein
MKSKREAKVRRGVVIAFAVVTTLLVAGPASAQAQQQHYGRCSKAEFDRIVLSAASDFFSKHGMRFDMAAASADPNAPMKYLFEILSSGAHSTDRSALIEMLEIMCDIDIAR